MLRLSARRLVVRVSLQEEVWLWKVDSPRRSFERLRGRLRPPALLREAENLKQLGLRLPSLPVQVYAEQLDARNGIFARRWLEGRRGDAWEAADCPQLGRGLAKLHQLGWTDPDLSPQDLLLNDDGELLPLDLGHAHLHDEGPTPAKARRRDLQRFLGGLPPGQARAFAPTILAAYSRELDAPGAADILQQAEQWRSEILRRHSRRCLRRTRDFEPQGHGCRRTEDLPPGRPHRIKVSSPRRARRLFRFLYEFELLQLPALRVRAFGHEEHWFVEVGVPEGWRTASEEDQEAVEACRQTFRRMGFEIGATEAEKHVVDEAGVVHFGGGGEVARL